MTVLRVYLYVQLKLVSLSTFKLKCDRQKDETINTNATLQSAGSFNGNLPASTSSCTSISINGSAPAQVTEAKSIGSGTKSHSNGHLISSTQQFPMSSSSHQKTPFLQLLVYLCVVIVPASSEEAATSCVLSNVTETLSQRLLVLLNDSKSYHLSSSREYLDTFILVYLATLVLLCLVHLVTYCRLSLFKACKYIVFAAVFPEKETYPRMDKFFWSFRWLLGNIKRDHCRSYTSTRLEQSHEHSIAPVVIKSNLLANSGNKRDRKDAGKKKTVSAITLHSYGSGTTSGEQSESCWCPILESAWFPQLKVCWLNAPLLLHLLTCWCAVLPTASHETDANCTVSNVTEIFSQQLLVLWNGSESYQLSDAGKQLDPHDTRWSIFVGLVLLCLTSFVIFSIFSFVRKLETSELSIQRIECDYSASSEACEGNGITNESNFTLSHMEEISISAVGTLQTSRNDIDMSLSDTLSPSQPSQESGFYSRTPDPLSQTATSSHDNSAVSPEDLLQFSFRQSEGNIQVLERPPVISRVNSSDDLSYFNDIQEATAQEETGFTATEGCELVCAFPVRRICGHSTRGGVQEEVTQPNGQTSELAGVTSGIRERAHRHHPSQAVNFDEPLPQAQGVSSVETIPVQISPESQLLAFNACVDESQHSPPNPNKLVDAPPDYTPITLGSSIHDVGGILRYTIALPEAEMSMLQPGCCCVRPHVEQGNESLSAPVYPLLSVFRLPSTNGDQVQPLLPSLPALPSIATQVAYVPVTYVP